MKAALVGFAALALPGPALAAPYEPIMFESRVVALLDRATFRIDGDIRRGWTIAVLEQMADGADYLKAQLEFNCREETSRVTFVAGYRIDGTNVSSESGVHTPMEPVIPGSNTADQMRVMCSPAREDRLVRGLTTDAEAYAWAVDARKVAAEREREALRIQ